MGALSGGGWRCCAGVALLLWGTLTLAAADDAAPLLSDRPLFPAWLRALDAELVISADSIEWQDQALHEVHVPLRLNGGEVLVREAHVRVAGGEVLIDASRAASGTSTVQLSATHVTLGELPALRPYVSGVPIDVEAKLTGTGDNLRAWAASANGRLQLRNTGPGIVRHGFEEVGDNLVYHFISAFEVFRRNGSDAHLECLALDLPFVNGVALDKQSMALRTRRLHVRGGGRVDLHDESLDLVFKPETRGPIKLQSLKAVERVSVRGYLRAPQVSLDSAHLVGRAARLGLDVANLGGGAVINRLLRRKSAPGLCAGAVAAPLAKP